MDRKVGANAAVRKPTSPQLSTVGSVCSDGRLEVDRPHRHGREQKRKAQAHTGRNDDRQEPHREFAQFRAVLVLSRLGLRITLHIVRRDILSQQVTHDTCWKVGLPLAFLEEQAHRIFLQRKAIRTPVREVGGDHLQVDGFAGIAWHAL